MSLNFEQIKDAEKRLHGRINLTPLLQSEEINDQIGGRVLFKAECLQKTGSFKIRGASNLLLSLDDSEIKPGVVAFSSGNHAQGVALAAKLAGVSAKIVIPEDAPAVKINNTRNYGAEVILFDRQRENRADIVQDIAAREGRVIVPPFDDERIIAGQGTVGLELARQLKESGIDPDFLLCPCGGGGLIAGVSTALSEFHPTLQSYATEPQYFDDTRRSLLSGERISNEPGQSSICDAILTERPGEITFPINQKNLSGGLAVSDEQVIDAMKTIFNCLKLVVEPGGASGFAALTAGLLPLNGRTAVVILSGGNIDRSKYLRLLHESE